MRRRIFIKRLINPVIYTVISLLLFSPLNAGLTGHPIFGLGLLCMQPPKHNVIYTRWFITRLFISSWYKFTYSCTSLEKFKFRWISRLFKPLSPSRPFDCVIHLWCRWTRRSGHKPHQTRNNKTNPMRMAVDVSRTTSLSAFVVAEVPVYIRALLVIQHVRLFNSFRTIYIENIREWTKLKPFLLYFFSFL